MTAEAYATVLVVFDREPPRWHILPADLQHGVADITAGERAFVARHVRRYEVCDEATRGVAAYDCSGCAGTGREFSKRRSERPPSLRAALVLAAEALAREAAVRLWPWRGRRRALLGASDPPRHVVWRVDEADGPLELMHGTAALCPSPSSSPPSTPCASRPERTILPPPSTPFPARNPERIPANKPGRHGVAAKVCQGVWLAEHSAGPWPLTRVSIDPAAVERGPTPRRRGM